MRKICCFVPLVVLIPLPSDGSSSTSLIKSDNNYKAPWNTIRQQRRLPAAKKKFDGIEIPNKCQDLKGGKFDKCMEASLATLMNSNSKEDIGTTSSLASGIVSSWNEHEHQPTVHGRPPKKHKSPAAAPSVSFISSSPSTVSAFQSPSHAHAPTHDDSVSSLSMDDTASPTSLLYPSDVDANASNALLYSPTGSAKVAYVNIGNYYMTLTIYSNPRTDTRHQRQLRIDDSTHLIKQGEDEFNNHTGYILERIDNDDMNARQYELAATKQHLYNMYVSTLVNQSASIIDLVSLELHFEDKGSSDSSQGMLRHSTFHGKVGFEYAEENAESGPSQQDLETITLDAFSSQYNKQDFLRLFHELRVDESRYSLAYDEAMDMTHLYGVSVNVLSDGAEQVETLPPGILHTSHNDTAALVDVMATASSPSQNMHQIDSDNSDNGNTAVIATITSIAIFLTAIFAVSFYLRKRFIHQQKPCLKYAKYYYDSDEEIVFGDICDNVQYDNDRLKPTSNTEKEMARVLHEYQEANSLAESEYEVEEEIIFGDPCGCDEEMQIQVQLTHS